MTQVVHASELTIQGVNAALTVKKRTAIANEIYTLRQGLIGMANTKYLDRPIFGGTVSNAGSATVAYDTNGNYLGDNGQVNRNIAPGVQVTVNVNGPQVFGSGAAGLFTVLDKISQD